MEEHLLLDVGDVFKLLSNDIAMYRDFPGEILAGHSIIRRVLAVQSDGYVTQGLCYGAEPAWDVLEQSQAFIDRFAKKLMSRPESERSDA